MSDSPEQAPSEKISFELEREDLHDPRDELEPRSTRSSTSGGEYLSGIDHTSQSSTKQLKQTKKDVSKPDKETEQTVLELCTTVLTRLRSTLSISSLDDDISVLEQLDIDQDVGRATNSTPDGTIDGTPAAPLIQQLFSSDTLTSPRSSADTSTLEHTEFVDVHVPSINPAQQNEMNSSQMVTSGKCLEIPTASSTPTTDSTATAAATSTCAEDVVDPTTKKETCSRLECPVDASLSPEPDILMCNETPDRPPTHSSPLVSDVRTENSIADSHPAEKDSAIGAETAEESNSENNPEPTSHGKTEDSGVHSLSLNSSIAHQSGNNIVELSQKEDTVLEDSRVHALLLPVSASVHKVEESVCGDTPLTDGPNDIDADGEKFQHSLKCIEKSRCFRVEQFTYAEIVNGKRLQLNTQELLPKEMYSPYEDQNVNIGVSDAIQISSSKTRLSDSPEQAPSEKISFELEPEVLHDPRDELEPRSTRSSTSGGENLSGIDHTSQSSTKQLKQTKKDVSKPDKETEQTVLELCTTVLTRLRSTSSISSLDDDISVLEQLDIDQDVGRATDSTPGGTIDGTPAAPLIQQLFSSDTLTRSPSSSSSDTGTETAEISSNEEVRHKSLSDETDSQKLKTKRSEESATGGCSGGAGGDDNGDGKDRDKPKDFPDKEDPNEDEETTQEKDESVAASGHHNSTSNDDEMSSSQASASYQNAELSDCIPPGQGDKLLTTATMIGSTESKAGAQHVPSSDNQDRISQAGQSKLASPSLGPTSDHGAKLETLKGKHVPSGIATVNSSKKKHPKNKKHRSHLASSTADTSTHSDTSVPSDLNDNEGYLPGHQVSTAVETETTDGRNAPSTVVYGIGSQASGLNWSSIFGDFTIFHTCPPPPASSEDTPSLPGQQQEFEQPTPLANFNTTMEADPLDLSSIDPIDPYPAPIPEGQLPPDGANDNGDQLNLDHLDLSEDGDGMPGVVKRFYADSP